MASILPHSVGASLKQRSLWQTLNCSRILGAILSNPRLKKLLHLINCMQPGLWIRLPREILEMRMSKQSKGKISGKSISCKNNFIQSL